MRKLMSHHHAGRQRAPAWRYLLLACTAPALILAGEPSRALAQDPPAPGVAAEIRAESGGKMRSFYRARGWWPLWVEGDRLGPQADRLIDLLETADLDGLDRSDYDVDELRAIVDEAREGSPEALGRAEVRLTRAFASYARAMRRAPSVRIVYLDAELQPAQPTELAVLRAAGVAPSFAAYLDQLGWMNPIYAQLRDGVARYRKQWGDLPEFAVPSGAVLRPGSRGERVVMLRSRLGLPAGSAFDKALTARVRAFQSAHGLPSDAVVGAKTIDALNKGAAHYEHLFRLNLERARVLPATRKRYIVVDAAAARLWLYEDGEVKDTMKVIVGKPTEQTPMLAGMMRYAVVNPYWNVPPDLVRRRIVPKVVDEGAQLKALGYEALDGWTSNARVLDQSEIDWSAIAAGNRELRVRQLPGGTNAMGRMKFMFPNDLGIYLHDTPDKALFKEADRRFSSGCVRVEDAERLAVWLFGKRLQAESDAPEQMIYLPEAVPVYITYLTAAPTENGIAFREDVYGRDGDQAEQLARR